MKPPGKIFIQRVAAILIFLFKIVNSLSREYLGGFYLLSGLLLPSFELKSKFSGFDSHHIYSLTW
jgi:hypothetical protein